MQITLPANVDLIAIGGYDDGGGGGGGYIPSRGDSFGTVSMDLGPPNIRSIQGLASVCVCVFCHTMWCVVLVGPANSCFLWI